VTVPIGIPRAKASEIQSVSSDVGYAKHGHYFTSSLSDEALANQLTNFRAPLSVIYQVTRRCNFDCNFCSEIDQLRDPALGEIQTVHDNLHGVSRVFLSGGEPLIRRDIVDIVDMFSDYIVGIPTNATRGVKLAPKLAGKVSFMNVGLEGPRNATNKVRGDYDAIMAGIFAFREAGLEVSLSSVVLRSLLEDLPYLIQIGDVLQAGKIKLIHPIRKGNGANLPDSEFLSLEESAQLFARLDAERSKNGWRPQLRMTTWTPDTEGYSILIYPDSTAWAWPVYGGYTDRGNQGGTTDKTMYLGNLRSESIQDIWEKYPFKLNHLKKYLGKSISVSDSGAGVISARRKQHAVER